MIDLLTLWTLLSWVCSTIYRKHPGSLSRWLIESQSTTVDEQFVTNALTTRRMLVLLRLTASAILSTIKIKRAPRPDTSSILLACAGWILVPHGRTLLYDISIDALTAFLEAWWTDDIGSRISSVNRSWGGTARVGLAWSWSLLLHALHSYTHRK